MTALDDLRRAICSVADWMTAHGMTLPDDLAADVDALKARSLRRDRREPARKEKEKLEKKIAALVMRRFHKQRDAVIARLEAQHPERKSAPPGHEFYGNQWTGGLGSGIGGDGGALGHAEIISIVEKGIGITPKIISTESMKSDAFTQRMRDEFGQYMGAEGIAAINMDGKIIYREGYEDSALHEYIHSAGFIPDGNGIDPTVNEGLTQALTEDIAKEKGIVTRSGYTSAVDWVNKYIIPLTGMDRREFFKAYATTDNKQKFIAGRIWAQHGNKFANVEDWGTGIENRFMNQVGGYSGYDMYLSYLVDELGVKIISSAIDMPQKVVETIINGKHVRIIYMTAKLEAQHPERATKKKADIPPDFDTDWDDEDFDAERKAADIDILINADDWSEDEDDDFDAELIDLLTQARLGGIALFGKQSPITIDYTLTNMEAARAAREYAYGLVKGIDDTSREALRQAVSMFVETPGMTIGDIVKLLPYDEDRALLIAVTEVTRAYATGQQTAGETLKAEFPDVRIVKHWFTNEDTWYDGTVRRGVCELCEEIDGKEVNIDEDFYEIEDEYQDGNPPRHCGCRCWTEVSTDIGA